MRIIPALLVALMATTSTAQTTDLIEEVGLAAAEGTLSALPNKTPSDHFAIGAIRFLRGIEKTLQVRWQHNLVLEDFDMPVLRLPVPSNPKADPFSPELIVNIFADLRADMDASRAALGMIPKGATPALDIDLDDLWFDINMNGKRDDGEGLVGVGLGLITDSRESLIVRFDSADVAWLTAYTHLISGVSELVVAFDPTEAISQVLSANEQMIAMREGTPMGNMFDAQFGGWVDQFAMVYGALNQQPKAENTRAAHAHFLAMIAQNKVFWRAVAAEKDNVNEWIPNKHQTAALGFDMAPETGASWQGVLGDAEAVLNGDLLVSYWRIAPAGGINIEKLFMDPPVVDIVTWIQGYGLLEYMERGPTVDTTNLRRFERMVSGNTLFFGLLFN